MKKKKNERGSVIGHIQGTSGSSGEQYTYVVRFGWKLDCGPNF